MPRASATPAALRGRDERARELAASAYRSAGVFSSARLMTRHTSGDTLFSGAGSRSRIAATTE